MPVTRFETNILYDADGTVLSEETVEVDVTEQVRKDNAETAVRDAIARILQIQDLAAGRNPIQSAANLAEANQRFAQIDNQLDAAASAISDLSEMLRKVIVHSVVPDLLDDDTAAGDLDT